MLTVYIAVAMLLVVAVAGAPLARLATVRIRHVWLLWLALLDQVLVISVLPDSHAGVLAAAHIASYLAAAICVVLNRRTPGIWFIGLGGALNGVTITLNGGTLPASGAALEASGHPGVAGEFSNSAVLADAKLAVFGDIFATPAWLPGNNVFSIGDVFIWLGLAWLLWRTCGPTRAGGGRRRAGRDYVARHSAARPAALTGWPGR
jgi:hypothetical protein